MFEEVENLYRQVYSEPPEFQHWDETLGDYLWKNRPNISTYQQGEKLVGLAISMPLAQSAIAHEIITTPDGEGPVGLYFPENSWYLSDLLVHPNYRRQGIGSRLLRVAILKSLNTPWVLRVSTSREGAIALYEKIGFKKVPASQIVYYGSIRARKQFMVKSRYRDCNTID